MLFLLLFACDAAEDTAATTTCVTELPENNPENATAGYRYEPVGSALPWNGESRSFNVNIWYPTDEPSSVSARYIGTFDDAESRVDSPVREDDCQRPLILYSHGSQGWGGNNSPMLRTLVANGWIAAAPDHTDNTLIDDDDEKPVIYPLIRAADIIATLDWFEGLDASDPLFGHVDTSRVVVLGHSYGAQTAWILSGVGFSAAGADTACAGGKCTPEERSAFDAPMADARIVAVQPMAGAASADFVDDTTWAGTKPILYVTGSEDGDGAEAFDRAETASAAWVELEGGCHESFTSTTLACDTLDKAVATPIITEFTTAFAWSAVLGSEDAGLAGILDGSSEVSAIATVKESC